jgi:hypothetical protein
MTWADFLKYSKFIVIFYVIAFALVLIGIWSGSGVNWRFIWSGVVFGGAAAFANAALGIYHERHRTEMTLEKNIYLAKQEAPQVITGEGNELETRAQHAVEEQFRAVARKVIKEERGW